MQYPDVDIKKNFEKLGLNYIQGVRLLVNKYLTGDAEFKADKFLNKLESFYKDNLPAVDIDNFSACEDLLLRELLPILVKFVDKEQVAIGLKGKKALKAILDGAALLGVWFQGRQPVVTTMQYAKHQTSSYQLRSMHTMVGDQMVKDTPLSSHYAFGSDYINSKLKAHLNSANGIIEQQDISIEIIEQQDIPICQLTSEQKREYLSIFSDHKPAWFDALEPYEKDLLKGAILEGVQRIYPRLTEAQLSNMKDQSVINRLDAILRTIPSSLRRVPGLANFGEHMLVIMNEHNQPVFRSSRYRGAVAIPFDLKDETEKLRLAEQNIVQFIQAKFEACCHHLLRDYPHIPRKRETIYVPVAIQALLQSGNVNCKDMRVVIESVRKRLEDGEFDKQVEDFTFRPKLFFSNHPINFWRRLGRMWQWFYPSNDANSVELVQYVASFLERSFEQAKSLDPKICDVFKKLSQVRALSDIQLQPLSEALNHLKKARIESHLQPKRLIQLLSATIDYLSLHHEKTPEGVHRVRNLFFSALEQIIVDAMGGLNLRSCKSGKDREGVETLHVDAMLIYYHRYGEFPKYNDGVEKRARFVEILSDLFLSQHEQVVADSNMPGTEGLQNVERRWWIVPGCMPEDVVEKINQKNLDIKLLGDKFSQFNKPTKPWIGQISKSEVIKLSNSEGIQNRYNEIDQRKVNWQRSLNDKLYLDKTCFCEFNIKELKQNQSDSLYNRAKQKVQIFYDGDRYYKSVFHKNKQLPTQYSLDFKSWLPVSHLSDHDIKQAADYFSDLKKRQNWIEAQKQEKTQQQKQNKNFIEQKPAPVSASTPPSSPHASESSQSTAPNTENKTIITLQEEFAKQWFNGERNNSAPMAHEDYALKDIHNVQATYYGAQKEAHPVPTLEVIGPTQAQIENILRCVQEYVMNVPPDNNFRYHIAPANGDQAMLNAIIYAMLACEVNERHILVPSNLQKPSLNSGNALQEIDNMKAQLKYSPMNRVLSCSGPSNRMSVGG